MRLGFILRGREGEALLKDAGLGTGAAPSGVPKWGAGPLLRVVRALVQTCKYRV